MQTEGEEDIFGLSGGHRFPCNMNISQTPAFAGLILEGAAEEDAQRGKDFNASNEKGAEKKHSVMFFKMFSFADYKDVFLMTVGAVAAAANGLMTPLMTLLSGEMIQSFGGSIDTNNLVHEVSKVALKLVYLAVGAASASFLQVACWMATGERQAAQIRNLYLRTILRQEIAFFDADTSTGEVIGRISGDTVLIQDAMGEKVGQFIQLTTTFLGGFIIAFTRGWLLSLVMLSMFPLIVLAGGAMVTVVSKMALVGQKAYAEAAAIVEESVSSIRTVASFTGEKVSVNKYKKSLESAYRSSVHEGFAAGLGVGAVTLIMFCGYSWGTWFGSELILHKGYTGGRVMSVIFSLVTGSFALGQASPCITAFAAGQAAFYKMFEMINRKPLINAYETTGLKLNDISGDIEFRDVDFSYPSRPSEQIFRGFSLHVHTGTTVALVGESGSGKSTVISLIERFYDPQAGKVLIDGVNLKELQLRWIRGKIGLVSQEPVLFASSIRNNIAYGKDGATIAEIAAAAELANASKFIDKLPQGLDTVIGERGKQLSGGQKQRIAIARAILKDPRILLLDEATSALDLESEGVVQEALDRVLKNRTTVIVAHRLSTVRNAHTIAVLSRGSIVEKGSHSDLLKDPNGAYCQLLRLQEDKKYAYDQVSDCRQDKSGMPLGSELKTSLLSLVGVEVQESRPNELVAKMAIQEHKQVSVSRLVYLNKPEIPWLILGTIAAAANGLLFPIFGVLMSSAINTFYQPPPKLQTDSRHWCLLFLMFGLVGFLAAPAKSYFFALSGSKLIKRIRLMTFEKVMNMEMTWFDDPENSSGAIGARLAADAATVRSLVGDALALLVQNITTTAAGLIIAFAANWQLSLVISGLIPLLALNGWVQLKFMQGFSADAKMAYEEASQVASEAVGNIRTIASFSAEDKVMELYKKKCEGPMSRGIKQGVISGVGFGASFFLLFCVYASCFYAGARLIQDGKTTFEEVFRVFFALAMAAIGISHSSTLAPDSSKAQAATASIFAILDRSSKIDSSNDSGLVLKELQGDIEFHHVTFKYPTRPDVQIFNDLCLTIKSGQTVALVGESGCGKSTAIALLQRFYDPDSGQISIDGIEIKKFQLRWLRRQMGLVSQEPVLFNGTIRANIAYGKEGNASETEVLSAATSANAHQFISGLQQGYDTFVGEGGMQLSGGQKQRVAIARAMIKEPAILLLDEATSALDSESERVVQEALDRVRVNRTTVMIAHRLSTIRSADMIAVVKNGVIVEKGKHDTLININGGAYASLVTLHSRPS